MKKIRLIKCIAVIFILLFSTGINNYSANRDTSYLHKVLINLEQISTASYYSTNYFCYPGDTIPIGNATHSYFKEYNFPADTSVGALYVKMMEEDTTKALFAYDGKVRININRRRNYYTIDDFSHNTWPYRTVYAPFLSRAKAILKYALTTKDSISIIPTDLGTTVKYEISIFNKRIEFVGILPINITQRGSNEGVISIYEIWIDKRTDFPYKLARTTPDNTMVEVIKDIETDNLKLEDFSITDYISDDLLLRNSKNAGSSKKLLGKIASDWSLKSTDDKFVTLSKINNKIVVIQFTSMFCGTCIQSLPFMKQVRKEYNSNDVQFVSIISEDNITELHKYIKQKKINYNFLILTEDVTKDYHVELIPTFFILDKKKTIRKVITGYKEGETDINIKKTIKEIMTSSEMK